jgi:SET domain-containing protein
MSGSIRSCVQCSGTTIKGDRCKKKTCQYADYCNTHTVAVVIKPSGIKNAGLGLYAKKDFEKGEIVGKYFGEKMTQNQFDNQTPSSDYGLTVKKNVIYDAKNTQSTPLRFANDARSILRTNTRFSKNFKSNPIQVSVVATKNIKKLREIFLDYGPNYWA